jgi:hypothetical protein
VAGILGCFTCGLPQAICRRWEVAEGQGGIGRAERPVPGRGQIGEHVASTMAVEQEKGESEEMEERLVGLMGERARVAGKRVRGGMLVRWMVQRRVWGGCGAGVGRDGEQAVVLGIVHVASDSGD